MKNIKTPFLLIIILVLFSCQEEREIDVKSKSIKKKPAQVVVISINAPEKYFHSLRNDSLGKVTEDSPGPKFVVPSPKYSYINSLNQLEEWIPEINKFDTLRIEVYNRYIELATQNPYSFQRQTYLLQRGDTVIFRYENKFPIANV